VIEDFIIPATPGAARRLRHLGTLTPLDLDTHTLALADEGLLTVEDLDLVPTRLDREQQGALQNLLDQDLRGILCTKTRRQAREVVMSAAKLRAVRPLVIVTSEASSWVGLVQQHGLTYSADIYDEDTDVLFVGPFDLTQQPVLSKRRGGMLIFDSVDPRQHVSHEYAGPAREFAKTVVICDVSVAVQRANDAWSRGCDLRVVDALGILYQQRAVEVLKSIIEQTSNIIAPLRARGFTKFRRADFYPVFNVIVDLMGDHKPS
jgi:hypothetical protein